jgi:outer membrane protein TolC
MNKALSLAISLILLFSVIPPSFAALDEPIPTYNLSVEEAIRVAFKNNKDIQIEEEGVNIAKAGILAARSAFLPKLNANSGYTHNGGVLSLPVTLSTKKDIGVFTGYKNDNKAGIELDQNIFSGGANTANLRKKQVNLRIQWETLRARKLDIEFEVKRLYYGQLLARETEKIAQSLLAQAKSHYEEVKNKFEQGTASRFDLLQSKVQVSKLEPELIKAINALDLISAELKKLLSLKLRFQVELKDDFSYSPIEIQESEFLKIAYLEKPEMNLLSLGVDVSKWSIEIARAGDRPQVNANAGYNYRSNDWGDMINKRHNNWDAGISVSIPIFDGFSTKAKVDEARARYKQAKLEKENLGEEVAVDIKKACLDLQKAQSVINSQKDSIEEAAEALKIAEVRYDFGEGTNLDVMDAQVSLSAVKKNLSEAVFDYLMAQAFLSRTMGQSNIKESIDEKTH